MTRLNDKSSPIPAKAGVGFKPEHAKAIFAEESPAAGWFEVHAENYMGAGGRPHATLTALRERFPLSVHGVGLSIGAETGLNADHVARLAQVVERYQPGLVSEHLAWSTHDTHYFNDLLPVPYTRETLDRVVAHVSQVQDALKRQILLENPSTYVRFESSTMSELDFLIEIARRSGCGLLLDVNNVFVSATNHGYSPEAYIDAFPLAHVGEVHLGGHAEDEDDMGVQLLIDTHDREVIDPVWALYARLIGKTGALPTLVEWDSELPEWPVLAAEARRASEVLERAAGQGGDVRAA
ncbi:DUF692 domain-containing protein [Tepidamorphus sp. 3E244]|uniref:MNIO family bufferin maturase n=1 Tax=Tepidamorphus sp. 3E244 TaxID=3385498 RepID=UPI0038FD0CFE